MMTFQRIIATLIISTFCSMLQAQSPGNRYQDAIFDKAKVSKNLKYRENPSTGIKPKAYKYDFYEAKHDSAQQRPLVIWMHGGGFKLGKKTSRGIPGWCRQFAERGYVCAAINYRKSDKKPLSNFPDLVEACNGAINDLQYAVAYFKQHARELHIDTSKIFLAGNSAGAMMALQAAYSTPGDMKALFDSTYKTHDKESVFIPQIAGVISFWGCLFDTAWVRQAHVPIAMVHGLQDNLVPYKKGETPMYGSYLIKQQADALQIPNALKTYDNYGHELQKSFFPFLAFPAVHKRWKEAGAFAADFLYHSCFQ